MRFLKNFVNRQTDDRGLVDLFRNEYRNEYDYQRLLKTNITGEFVKNFLRKAWLLNLSPLYSVNE